MTARGNTAAYDPRRRIAVVVGFLLLASLGLMAQLLRIQVLDRDRYVAWGEDQRFSTTPLPGERGDILDRNGEELAISLNTPVVYADPLLVVDPAAEAELLAPVLGRDVSELEALLAQDNRFVYLDRQATEREAAEVRSLELDGVFIGEEPQRFHPNGDDLAKGILGFVGYDNESWSGLESQYESTLAGIPGELVSERGLNGRTIPEGELERRPAVDGSDIQITLDRALQFQAEQVLAEHVAARSARGGIVIISEPATGDVLAMASVVLTESGSVERTSDNRAVTWVYEPASVMKAITFAAVLNDGLASPSTPRLVDDELQIYEETFTDDAIHDPQVMTTLEILVASSNIGTILWADQLGDARLHHYLEQFGFGQPSGLDFPGESAGILADVDDWSGTDFASIAIGQGIAVTPLQMLTAFNVIANDGLYVAPRLVSTVHSGDEATVVPAPPARRVIGRETAKAVAEMLNRVVEGGTARAAQVPGYSIAAKTGTARKVQESGGYQDADGNFHHVATVAGFFPAESPRYSMIVILDEPQEEIYASRVAAPLFAELAGWTLRHFQVSPAVDVVLEASAAPTPEADQSEVVAIGDGQ